MFPGQINDSLQAPLPGPSLLPKDKFAQVFGLRTYTLCFSQQILCLPGWIKNAVFRVHFNRTGPMAFYMGTDLSHGSGIYDFNIILINPDDDFLV